MKSANRSLPKLGLFGLTNVLRLLCLGLSIGIMCPLAHAVTDQLFYEQGYSGAEQSETIDLNSYSVNTITSISIHADASAASQSGDDIEFAAASVALSPGGACDDDDSGRGNAYVGVTLVASNITKNGSGHWIAATVVTNDGTFYDVDLGTGSVDLSAGASGTGYANTWVYADITY